MKVKNLPFLYLFLHINLVLNAQNLYFNSYTTREGLSQNSVYSIAQTNEGFMWFGTQHGLNRFDGKKITKADFIVEKGNGKINYSQMITSLLVDDKDNFWIGTTTELFLFDRYTNKITNPNKKFPNFVIDTMSWIEELIQDGTGNIWVLAKNHLYSYNAPSKGFNLLNNEFSTQTIAISLSADKKDIFIATEKSIAVYNKSGLKILNKKVFGNDKRVKIRKIKNVGNTLWLIANDNSVWKYDIQNGKHELILFKDVFHRELPLIDPTVLHGADENTLWMGSRSEGVLIANVKTGEVRRSSTIYHQNALVKKFVLSLFTDSQHNTWIGLSGGGFAKYDYNNTKFGLWRNEPKSGAVQNDNMIMSMYTENDKDFYCGTMFGGLLHTNITTNESQYYLPPLTEFNKTDANNIYAIVKGEKNLLWLATWGGLCSFDKITKRMKIYNEADQMTLQLSALISLKNKNKLLVGGYHMGLRLFNLDNNKWEKCIDPDNVLTSIDLRPRYMQQQSDSIVLIATESKNVVKYNLYNGKFTFYNQFFPLSLMATHFYIDKDYWWIGTNDGLIQASARDQKVVKFWNKENGLADNVVYSILKDDLGQIWIGSNNGLCALNPTTGICKKFNENDGLQSVEFNNGVCLKDSNGDLWFGGINGFNKVPSGFDQPLIATPSPLIVNIHVMNEALKSDTAVSYLSSIKLAYNQNFINFEFQCPYYSQTENIVYKYKLSPVDTGWVYSGTRNFVNYTQLPPGKYTFEVKAANANLIWSAKAAMITFSIDVPWYKTWWFYAFVAVSFLFFIVRTYLQRLSALKKDAEIKHQIAQTEMAALKAQMNPHFIFNCINSIDAYIQCNDKYLASFYLNKFAKLIRNTLESSKHNLVPFQKDLETIKLYVEMEEMRNDSKFKTKYNIDTSIENLDIKIPPLIVQPYIENAILHGLRNRDGNEGLLSISISKNEDYLYYEITDNGIGRVASRNISINKLPSYGMQLSEDRVRLFNDDANSKIEILDNYTSDGKASGTTIKLKLKIN